MQIQQLLPFLALAPLALVATPAAAMGDDTMMKMMLPDTELDLSEVELCDSRNPISWRDEQELEGVAIAADPSCNPDRPELIAAAVKGTDNVSLETLNASGLAPDAVLKGADLDGDGDPDVITIKLEIVGLNEGLNPLTTHEIAPGIAPAFWAFAPKSTGMATENMSAAHLVRMPSPSIRIEQGDQVELVVENTHYLPHTVHLHGVDHPYLDENGEGNDGIPQTSEKPIMPGESRTYNMQPRVAGTMAYHCHVQPDVHVLMGLSGMFIIEENRPNNWLQTINIGAGFVRHSSVVNEAAYAGEYDLHYQDIDKELHSFLQTTDDVAEVAKFANRVYDITERTADYFVLNGRSWPYTLRESMIIVEPAKEYLLRVFNIGAESLVLHTHGHKMLVKAYDGIDLSPAARYYRDVVDVHAAQRVDVVLNTTNDGLNSYGEGAWLYHDHHEAHITTDGIVPGGGLSMIVYENFLDGDGMPITQGVDLRPTFTPEYYQKTVPIWNTYDMANMFEVVPEKIKAAQQELASWWWILGLVAGAGVGYWFFWRGGGNRGFATARLTVVATALALLLLPLAFALAQMDMGSGEVSTETSHSGMEGIDKIHVMPDGSVMLGTGVTLPDAYLTPDGTIILGSGESIEPVLDMRSDKTLGVREPKVTTPAPPAAPAKTNDMSSDESYDGVSNLSMPGIDGIHVMPNGRVMTGDGKWLDDASVSADGVIILGSGEMIDPVLDMRSGGGIRRTEKSMVVNENFDTLPLGCSEIAGEEEIYVKAGSEIAEEYPGSMFTYDTHSFENIAPCTRVTVTFENLDNVRHQFMVHDLPPDTYPMGMFNIEVTGPGKETGTFITPADEGSLFVHCGVPEHEAKGMVAQIKVGNSEDAPEVKHFMERVRESTGSNQTRSLIYAGVGFGLGLLLLFLLARLRS